VVAEAEIALASRDLGWSDKVLHSAKVTLEKRGDPVNAAHARYLEIRKLLLIGRLGEAERALKGLNPETLPPALRAVHHLLAAGVSMRRLETDKAHSSLAQAVKAARDAGIPALKAEIENAAHLLEIPAARLLSHGKEKLLRLDEVEDLLKSGKLVVDACRYTVSGPKKIVPLAKRPTLFAIMRTLAEAWPEDIPRDILMKKTFGVKLSDESFRLRLRVEVVRLRGLLRGLAEVKATKRGFALAPLGARETVVLARPVEEPQGAVLAFLEDGELWSSSALALALGSSQRTVQRSLDLLAEAGKVQSYGLGRAKRWVTPPLPGITSILLLPNQMPVE
jgi:DNA-binding transcriptional ArsR family regulator